MNFKIFFFLLSALAVAGCNNSSRNKSAGESEIKDEPKFQYTAYSKDFELFAEADPFVVGESANILSHFTRLESFKPLDSATVTVRLAAGGQEITQVLDKPTRKGIYSFDIVPSASGSGMLTFEIKTGDDEYLVEIPGITVYSNEELAHEAAEKVVTSSTNTIVFTKEQSWKIDFSTANPEVEPFGQVIKTTARIESAPGDEFMVSAKTNGIVSVGDGTFAEGMAVTTGQTVCTVTGSGLADNNSTVRFAEAKNNYEKARADYERSEKLAVNKIVSEKDLLAAKTSFDNAKVVYETLKNNFSTSGQAVTSPATGFVRQIFVRNGEYVEAGQPVFVVSRNRSLILRAEVQQKYTSMLSSITSANIHDITENKSFTLEQLNGRIVSYGRAANSDNYLIPVTLLIDNTGGFVPGSFVELYLTTKTSDQAMTVPVSSLLEEQGKYFVLIQKTPELFEKREVRIGATDGIKTEIVQGLAAAERVVTRGAVLVKLSQASGALDPHAGHVH